MVLLEPVAPGRVREGRGRVEADGRILLSVSGRCIVTQRLVSDGITFVSPTVRIHEATSGYESPLAAKVIWPWIPVGAGGVAAAGASPSALASSAAGAGAGAVGAAGVTPPWNDVNHTVPGIVFEMSWSMWLHDTSVASSDVSCASSWSTCAACAFRSALSSIEACNSSLCASTAAFSSCLSDRLCLARYVGTPSNTMSPAAIASTGLSALEEAEADVLFALRRARGARSTTTADAGTTEREPDGSRQVRVEARVLVLGESDVTDRELVTR